MSAGAGTGAGVDAIADAATGTGADACAGTGTGAGAGVAAATAGAAGAAGVDVGAAGAALESLFFCVSTPVVPPSCIRRLRRTSSKLYLFSASRFGMELYIRYMMPSSPTAAAPTHVFVISTPNTILTKTITLDLHTHVAQKIGTTYMKDKLK